MMDNNFEAALSEFLDRHEYDDAEAALFTIVRAARGRRRNGCFGFLTGQKIIPGINKKILIDT